MVLKVSLRFLLARMHIDLLATKSVLGTTEWTLKNLPQGLKELDKAYDDVITRIQTQDEEDLKLAEQIITWLYYAIRPLTLQELRHALATRLAFETNPDATELDETFLPDDEVIVSVCAGIVALHLESNTVALVHYTTKEYFKRRVDRQHLDPFLRPEANIAETCLVYLSFERKELEQWVAEKAEYKRRSPRRRDEVKLLDIDLLHPLFRYAAQHWGDHAHGRLEQTTRDLSMKFTRQRTARVAPFQAIWEREYYGTPVPFLISGLFLASFFGLEDLVVALLEEGEDIAAKREYDWTALHMGVEGGHTAMVQLLLNNGAHVDAKITEKTIAIGGFFNPYDGLTALHIAAEKNHTEMLETLLKNGAEIDGMTSSNETALHVAAGGGHAAVVQLLLNNGAQFGATIKVGNREGVYDGSTALHLAAEKNHTEVLEILLKNGAEIDATTSSNQTALYWAALRGHQAAIKLLLNKGANLEAKTIDGCTPLYAAVAQSQEAAVKLLIERGADPCQSSVLFCAVRGRNSELVRVLLENGCEINQPGRRGGTALHVASSFGDVTMVSVLLEKGPNVAAKDDAGQTALHLAAQNGQRKVVQLLLDIGADATISNDEGKTALELAACNGYPAVVRLLEDRLGGEPMSEARLATL